MTVFFLLLKLLFFLFQIFYYWSHSYLRIKKATNTLNNTWLRQKRKTMIKGYHPNLIASFSYSCIQKTMNMNVILLHLSTIFHRFLFSPYLSHVFSFFFWKNINLLIFNEIPIGLWPIIYTYQIFVLYYFFGKIMGHGVVLY